MTQEDAHIKRDRFTFSFKKAFKNFKERQFHTTLKMKHAYNTFIQHTCHTKFAQQKIQHKMVVWGAGLEAFCCSLC